MKNSAILLIDFIISTLSNSETKIQQEIRLTLGQRSDLRLFRNETGKLPDPRTGRWVQFDWQRVVLTLLVLKLSRLLLR